MAPGAAWRWEPGARAVQAASPASFFEAIGGFGVRNDHYIRDVATFYLALGIVLFVAVPRPTWRVPVLLLASFEYGFHVINHVVDVASSTPAWVGPVDAVSLAVAAGIFVWTLRLQRLTRAEREDRR